MGETPLFQAVEMCLNKAVEILLTKGADPNKPTNDGRIPLHSAVAKKDINLISLLLAHKSNPNYKNKLYMQTPLHIAMKNSVNLTILELLLENGADLNITDKYDKTPFDYIQLEETREYLKNLISSKNFNHINNGSEENNILIKKEELDDELYSNSKFNLHKSIEKFNTPSKIHDLSREMKYNYTAENKPKFANEISIIEKNNPNNNFNFNNKDNNNNPTGTSNNNILNDFPILNNLNTNFFSGLKNNFNFSELLNNTEKFNNKFELTPASNNKYNELDSELINQENNAFDLSAQRSKRDREKDESNTKDQQSKKDINDDHVNNHNRNKNDQERYTIKIRDSNKFSLSDCQLKEIIQGVNDFNNNDEENVKNDHFNKIFNSNNDMKNNNLENHNNNKTTQLLRNFNNNEYATFENNDNFINFNINNNIMLGQEEQDQEQETEVEKIVPQNKNSKNAVSIHNVLNVNEEENLFLRQSKNTQHSHHTENNNVNYNQNNIYSNNLGEKPKTPKSVFSPMTFFKNNTNANSRNNSNSKNLMLMSEREKNVQNYDKDPFSFENNSLVNNHSNNNIHNNINNHPHHIPKKNSINNNNTLNQNNSLKNCNSNPLFNVNTSNQNNNQLNNLYLLSNRKYLKNDNEYLLDNPAGQENYIDFAKNLNLHALNSDNFLKEIENNKNNENFLDAHNKFFSEKPNVLSNHVKDKSANKPQTQDNSRKNSNKNSRKNTHTQNEENDDYSIKNPNIQFDNSKNNLTKSNQTDITMKNKSNNNSIQMPSTNLNNNNVNNIFNNQNNSQLFNKDFLEYNLENENNNIYHNFDNNNNNHNYNNDSELISYINHDNGYNHYDFINGNILKTGNFESFISKDHSRNSFIFLTNRQSGENKNRSYSMAHGTCDTGTNHFER